MIIATQTVHIEPGVQHSHQVRYNVEDNKVKTKYVAHKISIGDDQHVTVYVNYNNGQLSVDLGTETVVKLRVGDSKQVIIDKYVVEDIH